jgi:hypothetical protein
VWKFRRSLLPSFSVYLTKITLRGKIDQSFSQIQPSVSPVLPYRKSSLIYNLQHAEDGVSVSSKPLVHYLCTYIHNVKFHRTLIISTDGKNSYLLKESSLTRGLETAWRGSGGGCVFLHEVVNCWFYSFEGRRLRCEWIDSERVKLILGGSSFPVPTFHHIFGLNYAGTEL